MLAANGRPGNCLKAFHLDSIFTSLTGAVFPEFDPRQCPVYGLYLLQLEDFIAFFDQPLANFPHLFRSAHRISFESKYVMSKYYHRPPSLQQLPGIPKGSLHALAWLEVRVVTRFRQHT
jgi:hypothetical protein